MLGNNDAVFGEEVAGGYLSQHHLIGFNVVEGWIEEDDVELFGELF